MQTSRTWKAVDCALLWVLLVQMLAGCGGGASAAPPDEVSPPAEGTVAPKFQPPICVGQCEPPKCVPGPWVDCLGAFSVACGDNGEFACSGAGGTPGCKPADASTPLLLQVADGSCCPAGTMGNAGSSGCTPCGGSGQPVCVNGVTAASGNGLTATRNGCDPNDVQLSEGGLCKPYEQHTWVCDTSNGMGIARVAGVGMVSAPQFQLVVTNNGDWAVKGTANSSAWATEDYRVGIALNLPPMRDHAGRTIPGKTWGIATGGQISSQFANDGSNTIYDFLTGHDDAITADWERMKNASWACNLNVGAAWGDNIGSILEALGIATFLTFVAIFGGEVAKKGSCWTADGQGRMYGTIKNPDGTCPSGSQ